MLVDTDVSVPNIQMWSESVSAGVWLVTVNQHASAGYEVWVIGRALHTYNALSGNLYKGIYS